MSTGSAAPILFGLCSLLMLFRVPVAVALGLACVPIVMLDPDLLPMLAILLLIILFPGLALFLPRLIMPQCV